MLDGCLAINKAMLNIGLESCKELYYSNCKPFPLYTIDVTHKMIFSQIFLCSIHFLLGFCIMFAFNLLVVEKPAETVLSLHNVREYAEGLKIPVNCSSPIVISYGVTRLTLV